MVSHDIRLSSSHDFTKLLYCIISQPRQNIKLVQKLEVVLTTGEIVSWSFISYGLSHCSWKPVVIVIFNRDTMISHRLWDSEFPWVILRTYDHEIYGLAEIPLMIFNICS